MATLARPCSFRMASNAHKSTGRPNRGRPVRRFYPLRKNPAQNCFINATPAPPSGET